MFVPETPQEVDQVKRVLTKEEMVREVSRMCELTLADSQCVLDAMLDGMVGSLAKGDRIEIRGFGVFFTRGRKARIGRNPKTGANVDVPAKRVGRFRPAKEMLRMLNEPMAKNAGQSA